MKNLLLFLSTLLIAFSSYSQYAIDFGKSENGIQVRNNNNEELIMLFNYAGINKIDVNTNKGTFTQLVLDGSYRTGKVGNPQMPSTKKLIEIPFGASMNVEVIGYDVHDYVLSDYEIDKKLIPFQPSYPKNMDPAAQEFIFHENEYLKDEFTNLELASAIPFGTLRGINIAQLTVNPIRYNPLKNILRVYNNIEVKVAFKNGDDNITKSYKAKTQSPYFNSIYDLIINTPNSTKDNYTDNPDHTNYPVKYLIVTDPDFEDQMSDFVDWKTKKGFEVTMVTTDDIGSTAAEIKTWIHAQYNAATETDPAPTFFLLVGDTGQIPASQTGDDSGKATDLYYACMDGDDDIIPDMYYGRFSAQTSTQLQNMLDKVLYYEKYEFADASYLNDVTLIAGADGTWNPDAGQPTINYGTDNYFNTDHDFTTVNKYLDSYTGCYDDERFRVSFINYTAHCSETSWADPSLSISTVNNMNNENKYPLAIGNCCLAADFGYDECMGEAWMRKADGGAVAYIGSSPSSYWYEDFYWSVGAHTFVAGQSPTFEGSTLGAYDAPYVSDYLCVDGLIFVGNLAVTEAHDQGNTTSTTARYYWEAYNCLSDPSLFIYLTEGDENTVTHLPTVPIGVTEYEVTAEPGSYVAISKDGVLHGTAIVPESGTVIVEIEPITSGGDADIVVTRSQYQPYITTVPAAALNGPYLTVNEFTIIDESANGEVEVGESFNIDLKIKNVGTVTAEVVTATITTDDPYVESISNNISVAFPNIDADATATVTGEFDVVIKDSVPDQHVVVFNIELTDNSAESKAVYEATKTVVLNAPELQLADEIIIDDTDGNGNGLLDPGETAKLTVIVENIGHDAVATKALLSFPSKNPYLTLITTEHILGEIEVGESVIAEFTVEADASTPQGTPVTVVVNAEGGATPLYLDENNYEIIIGQVPEVIIGEGDTEAQNYPFNNYYKNNKSQILYLNDEIGPGSKVITDIAFDISTATADNTKRDLTNFSIKMLLTDAESMSAFVDMDGATTIFAADVYDLTGNTGWEIFDLTEPFPYDGTSNLIIEIVWGAIDEYASSSDRTKVNCSTTTNETVAYGYSDTETPAAFDGTSNSRPNLKMHVGQAHTLTMVIVDEADAYIADATVIVNGKEAVTDANGQAKFVYASEQYGLNYTANAYGYYETTGVVDLNGESVTKKDTLIAKPRYDITFSVTSAGTPVEDAAISFYGGVKNTNASGVVVFEDIIEEDGYSYEVYKANYVTVQGSVNADADKTVNVILNDDILTPAISGVENMREGDAKLMWTAVSAPNFNDSFENYADWAREFGEYTLIDNDGLSVFGSQDYDYPDENGATAFRIMNYTETTPQWDNLAGNTGNKIAASFAANDGATPNGAVNDDWLITPQISVGADFEFSFYAKSVTDEFGLERFNVGVSTTGTAIEDFTIITTGDYIEAPSTWTQFSYDLSSYFGENVYIAIQCVSADAFVFMVDDLKCAPAESKEQEKLFEGYSVYLDNMTTPIATDVQEMEYVYSGLTNGQEYTAGVKGLYTTGASDLVTYVFTYNQIFTVDFHVTIDGNDTQGTEVKFNEETVMTNSSGIASFNLESADAVAYTIKNSGYYDIGGTLDVEKDSTMQIALKFIPDVVFTVKDQDGAEVENAKVFLLGKTEYTDANGVASFEDIEAAEDILYRISLSNYQTVEGSVTVADDDVAVPVTINELPEVTFVIKDIDNVPVEAARVYFNGGMILSDANGVSEFENINPSENMPVKVRLSSYITHYDTIEVTLNNKIVNITLYETPDISFVVSDGINLLSGVSVNFNEVTQETDDNGEAVYVDIESGEYIYTATLAGYYEYIDTILVEKADIIENITMAIIPDVTFTVEYNNSPMENISVTFGSSSQLTDASGQVVFVDVAQGEYEYSILHNGYYPVTGVCVVEDTNMLMPVALAIIPDVSFVITDGTDPIAGAKVILNDIVGVSNTEGEVSFIDIEAGKYGYSIEKDLYFTKKDSLTVSDVDINETIVIELENYKVTFNVTDGTDAIENAFVLFYGETKSTDVDGTVAFEGVIIGENYEYSITKDGFENANGKVDVKNADVTEDASLILITYTVTFTVTDNNGAVYGATVAFNNESIETDMSGIATFMNVEPGTGLAYTVSKGDTHEAVDGTIDVDGDESADIALNIISINFGENSTISLYPNPTKGVFNINMGNLSGNFTITISDENGKTVKVIDKPQKLNRIDLSKQSKGIYLIQLTNGEQIYIEKIVLE